MDQKSYDSFEIDLEFDLDEIETKQIDITDFNKGFYAEDKKVHIINFLSSNRNIDLTKFKNYFNNKVENIINLDNKRYNQNYNVNVFPLIFYKKKISEAEPLERILFEYDEEDVTFESVQQYLTARYNIVVPYNYSEHTEKQQYMLLGPADPSYTGDFAVRNSIDCFLKNNKEMPERTRMLSCDNYELVGYVNIPNTYLPNVSPFVVIDFNNHMKNIESLKKNDRIFAYIPNLISCQVKEHDESNKEIKYVLESDKTRLLTFRYSVKGFSQNEFNIWPGKIGFCKHDKLTKVIVLTNVKAYREEAIAFLSISANEAIEEENIHNLTLHGLCQKYPELLDNITDNKIVSNYFQAGNTNDKKTNKRVKTKIVTKPLKKKIIVRKETSLYALSKHVIDWFNKTGLPSITPTGEKVIQEIYFKPGENIPQIFYSIEEAHSHKINSFDESAQALLVSTEYLFSQKQKWRQYNPVIFKLKQKQLENDIVVWDVGEELHPTKQVSFVDNKDQLTVQDIKLKLKRIKEINNVKSVFFHMQRVMPQYMYSTYRSYENFQGKESFQDDELIPEFGIKMDKTDNDDDSDGDEGGVGVMEDVITHLEKDFQIKLAASQKQLVMKTQPFSVNASNSNKFKAALLYACLFVIFSQINILNTDVHKSEISIEILYSYPINPSDEKYELIDFIAEKLESITFTANPFFDTISSFLVSQKNKTEPISIMLRKLVKVVLTQKPFLQTLLKTSNDKYVSQLTGIVGNSLNIKYPVWNTFRPIKDPKSKKHIQFKQVHNPLYFVHFPSNEKQRIQSRQITRKHTQKLGTHSQNTKIQPNQSINQIIDQDFFKDVMIIQELRNTTNDAQTNQVMNKISLEIKKLAKINNIEALMNPIFLGEKSFMIMNQFISYNLKDLFGKIVYSYQIRSMKEQPNHREFLELFLKTSIDYQTSVVEKCKVLLNSLLKINIMLPKQKDFDYILLYVLLQVCIYLGGGKDELVKYIITNLETKFVFKTMSHGSAHTAYLQEREIKKQKLMETYKGMDQDVRYITKTLVDMKIVARDDLINNDIQEDIEARLNNEDANYDDANVNDE